MALFFVTFVCYNRRAAIGLWPGAVTEGGLVAALAVGRAEVEPIKTFSITVHIVIAGNIGSGDARRSPRCTGVYAQQTRWA